MYVHFDDGGSVSGSAGWIIIGVVIGALIAFGIFVVGYVRGWWF